MQGHGNSEEMSKSKMGLRSLGQGSQKTVWNKEGWAGSSMWSSKNRTKACGWMGYAVGDLRTSSGHGEVSEFRCCVTWSVTWSYHMHIKTWWYELPHHSQFLHESEDHGSKYCCGTVTIHLKSCLLLSFITNSWPGPLPVNCEDPFKGSWGMSSRVTPSSP